MIWGARTLRTLCLAVSFVIAVGCTEDGSRDRGDRPSETTVDRQQRATTTTLPSESTSSTDSPATSSTAPSGGEGSIGVVGCSNTAQHVDGYLAVSELDRLIPTPLGGGDLDTWADAGSQGYESHWAELLSHVPPGSVGEFWVQICPRGAGPEVTGDDEAALSSIVDRLRSEYGDVSIQVSGINLYEDGYICRKMGAFGVDVSWGLADWGVANLGLTRGPETGPLGPGTVDQDGCHLSPAGESLVGSQLVAWFD